VRDGLARVPPVGRGLESLTHGNRVGPGKVPWYHVVAPRRRSSLDRIHKGLRHPHGPLVRAGPAAAKPRNIAHHQPCLLALGAVPVGGDEFAQLLPAQAVFLLHTLLDGCERVGHRGQCRSIQAKVHILHATVRGIQPLFDGSVAAQVQRQLRKDLVLVLNVKIVHVGHDGHGLLQMPDEAVPKDHHARLSRHPGHDVLKGQLKYPPQVDLGAVVKAVLAARDREPVAASIGTLARILLRDPVPAKTTHDVRRAQKLGATGLVLELDLHPAPQQSRIGLRPHGDAHVGGDAQLVRGLEDDVRDAVSDITARLIGPAQLQIGGVAQQDVGDVELGLLIGEDARRNVALIVGRQQHVQAPAGAAAVVHASHDQVPEDPLAGLTVGARRSVHQPGVHVGHLQQVLTNLRVRLSCRYIPRRVCGAGDPVLRPQQGCFQSIIEIGMLGGVQLTVVPHLLQESSIAQVEANLHVLAKVLLAKERRRKPVMFDALGQPLQVHLRRVIHLAVGAKVHHIAARQRSHRIDVHGMSAHQRAKVTAYRCWPEKATGRMVRLWLKAPEQHVLDRHARAADRIHQDALLLRRQNHPPVVVIHGANDLLLFAGLRQLGSAQRIITLRVCETRCLDRVGHATSVYAVNLPNSTPLRVPRAGALSNWCQVDREQAVRLTLALIRGIVCVIE